MKRKPSSDSSEGTNARTTAYTQLCSLVLPGQVVHASPTSSTRDDNDDADDRMANLNLRLWPRQIRLHLH